MNEVHAQQLYATPLAAPHFTPRLRLFVAPLLVEKASSTRKAFKEKETPVLELTFDYDGQIVYPDSEDSAWDPEVVCEVERNPKQERACQALLESFGAVELDCVDTFGRFWDTTANYLVSVDGNVHALCSFGACAVPQLRQHGWDVKVDAAYPYQVVEGDPPWFADVKAADANGDWFSLELGVEIDGERIDILPALLSLLSGAHSTSDLEDLLDVPAKCRAIAIGNNRYVALPPDRLRKILQVLGELYELDGVTTKCKRFAGVDAAILAELDFAFDAEVPLSWSGETRLKERGAALAPTARITDSQTPAGLQASLRPYQQSGLNWMQHLRKYSAGGVLADDMGLGKTLQTIAHLLTEKEAGRLTGPSLVVMPTSLIRNWQREIRRFAPSLSVLLIHGAQRHDRFSQIRDYDLVLTTYPLLVRDLEEYKQADFYYVILDEAQAIKNRTSQAFAAVKALCCEHRLALSGTPVENNLGELWSLFDFLNPGLLGSAEEFRMRFSGPIQKSDDDGRLISLRQRVAPYILRRMKNLVAKDLPPKTEIIRSVDISGAQRDLYEGIRVAAHARVRKAIREKGLAGSTVTILDALLKLRQVCCDPRLVKSDSAGEVKESAKYDFFFQLLEQQLGQKRRVLVFSQFTRMLALISAGLKERRIPYLALTGNTKDRQGMVDSFERGEFNVFLISLKAGGTGLNLTSADTVIHYDPWWNPAAQSQATDRAYRLGQTRPVFVYNLIVAGSVEERMLQLQNQKRYLADSILGTQGTDHQGLSEQDVDGLFEPLQAG